MQFSGSSPTSMVGTLTGRTERQVSANEYSAMLPTLAGLDGKKSLGLVGTMSTASESNPLATPYWNL